MVKWGKDNLFKHTINISFCYMPGTQSVFVWDIRVLGRQDVD